MLNQVIMVGRLVSDPKVIGLGDEKFTEITLAIPRSYKNKDGEYDTDLVPVTLWNAIAEHVVEYCKTGDLLGVKGKVECLPDALGDSKVTIVAEKVTFLSSKSNEE